MARFTFSCSTSLLKLAFNSPHPAVTVFASLFPPRMLPLLLLLFPAFAVAQPYTVRGRVLDSTGAFIPRAQVSLRSLHGHTAVTAFTKSDGGFSLTAVSRGDYQLTVLAPGFAPAEQTLSVHSQTDVDVHLRLAPVAQTLEVSTTYLAGVPDGFERLPGSLASLNASDLAGARVFTTDEALRKVPGIFARSEEGFGLRPNISVRGLNPTRSTQILLLEDGLPLAFAPYGDNASYYHPPIDRFDSLEVLKGGAQILYGPRTVGAVVNYLTPPPPEKWSGSLSLAGGNRDYANGHLRFGGTLRSTGLLFDLLRKQGRGARENLRHGLTDFNVKTLTTLSPKQTLSFRFNAYDEHSQVTYSGLRENEYFANPRANPFSNDHFDGRRYGFSMRHSWAPRQAFLLSTAAYATGFSRDWWRQSSNSTQRPNDSADPACGGMANLNTTCGNEGRLRDYLTWGLETKARTSFRLGTLRNEADFGLRLHFEEQERLQENGALPTSRSGVRVEDNRRTVRAFSLHLQNGILLGAWKVTPGVRVERIHYERINRLALAGAGVRGAEVRTFAIPGLGASYSPTPLFIFFAGVHRGFSPPRVEDIINNNTGSSVDLDAELSWNYEAGIRLRPAANFRAEATFFRMDFENQIVPASVAGGLGATLTNGGATLHQGLEFSGQYDWRNALDSGHGLFLRAAHTWLPLAQFQGSRFSTVPGFAATSVTGHRLPYAARNLLTAAGGFRHRRGTTVQLELVYTGRQFADDLSTVAATPDGQRGLLPGNAIWNLAFNHPVESLRSTFFLTVKNLFDRTVIVDRTRGILPGLPRLVQAGVHWSF